MSENTEDDIWEATEKWVSAVRKRYEGRDRDDLTQVFMCGPFAGMSEHEVATLADAFHDASINYPLHPHK